LRIFGTYLALQDMVVVVIMMVMVITTTITMQDKT
jgi:hypothetical protein